MPYINKLSFPTLYFTPHPPSSPALLIFVFKYVPEFLLYILYRFYNLLVNYPFVPKVFTTTFSPQVSVSFPFPTGPQPQCSSLSGLKIQLTLYVHQKFTLPLLKESVFVSHQALSWKLAASGLSLLFYKACIAIIIYQSMPYPYNCNYTIPANS